MSDLLDQLITLEEQTSFQACRCFFGSEIETANFKAKSRLRTIVLS